MPRYIDADALLETEPEVCADYGEEYGSEFGYSRDQIANAPTISPDEVRGVGKWIMPTKIDRMSFHIYHCSACGAVPCGIDKNSRYCPSCGAKMSRTEVEKATKGD